MKTVAIVGFGTMGRAIDHAIGASYQVIGLDRDDDLCQVQSADVIIVAVKPQVFSEVCQQLQRFISNQTIVSVMAGIRTDRIATDLGAKSVVRTMPNLGVASGQSVTAAHLFGDADKAEITALLELWGQVIWLEQESEFDAFTAIAGCGPAYFFELTHQLQQAAEKLGFEPELARQMVNGTLASAASMLEATTMAGDKVSQVASKGGATQAALDVFHQQHLDQIIYQAVQAAQARSQELST